jgi:hypothetical protein
VDIVGPVALRQAKNLLAIFEGSIFEGCSGNPYSRQISACESPTTYDYAERNRTAARPLLEYDVVINAVGGDG